MALNDEKVSNKEYEKITDGEERSVLKNLLPPVLAFFVLTDTLAIASVKPEISRIVFENTTRKVPLKDLLTKKNKRKIRRKTEKIYRKEFFSKKGRETIGSLEAGILRRIKRSIKKVPLNDGSGLPFPKRTGDILYNRRRLLQRSLSKTSATRITNAVHENIKKNRTVNQIQKDIRQHLSKTNLSRANIIAQTETTAIRNAITERAAKSEGYRKKIWNTQRDRRVRPAHRRLDRVKRLIKNNFRVVYKRFSLSLQYPSEVRCRCYLTFEK